MTEITITVGKLHEDLDEQMQEMLGEQYEDARRQNIEDFIHDTYRQIERAQEQQSDDDVADAVEIEDAEEV